MPKNKLDVPYFVEKYPNTWETMSMPESWKSVSTSAGDDEDWLYERSKIFHETRRNYIRDKELRDRRERDRKNAEFRKLRNSVVKEAARTARKKSPGYKAEKERKAAAKAAKAEKAAKDRASREASLPKSARTLRAEKREAAKESGTRKVRRSSNV